MKDFAWYMLLILIMLPIFADALLTSVFCFRIAKNSEGVKRIIAMSIPWIIILLTLPLWFDFINYAISGIERENFEMIKNALKIDFILVIHCATMYCGIR